MVRLGEELGYINRSVAKSIIEQTIEISKMISGLIKKL
jgi:hypothetical protein